VAGDRAFVRLRYFCRTSVTSSNFASHIRFRFLCCRDGRESESCRYADRQRYVCRYVRPL